MTEKRVLLQDEVGCWETRRLSMWFATRLGDFREWRPQRERASIIFTEENV